MLSSLFLECHGYMNSCIHWSVGEILFVVSGGYDNEQDMWLTLFVVSGGYDNEPTCGRPLGMRLDPDGYLIVCDAYLGIFKINVATG